MPSSLTSMAVATGERDVRGRRLVLVASRWRRYVRGATLCARVHQEVLRGVGAHGEVVVEPTLREAQRSRIIVGRACVSQWRAVRVWRRRRRRRRP